MPHYPGTFRGRQRHSSTYPGPDPFRGAKIAVVGGDSGPNLGDIVALPHLRELRDSDQLTATPIFDSLSELDHDHLIWCTGFRPALGPFRHLMRGRETAVKNLHLVGYGNWTGDGSATLMGVGPFAKHTAQVVAGRVDEARQQKF